jgi:hypothetical protein
MPKVLTFEESVTISGDMGAIWEAQTDVKSWPHWDPHIEDAGFDGPFEPGSGGWTKPQGAPRGPFTITSVDPERSYTTESKLPMGKMVIVNSYEPAGPGRVRVSRQVEVHGGFAPMFKRLFMKGMQRDIPGSIAALEREANRRAATAGDGHGQ